MREDVEAWGWDATRVLEVDVFDCEGADHGLDCLLGCGAEVFPGEFDVEHLKGVDQAVFVDGVVPRFCYRSPRAVLVGRCETGDALDKAWDGLGFEWDSFESDLGERPDFLFQDHVRGEL